MNIKKKLSCGFWNVGIIDIPVGEFLKTKDQPQIRWMKHESKDKFYADPFPVDEDNHYIYILAEEYSYYTEKGIIVRLKIDKTTMELVRCEKVLETDFHLSFPFPFKGYIIPEQYRSGNLIAYKAGAAKVVCDYPVIDPVVLDYKGKIYLFGTLPCEDNLGHNRSLFWFEFDGEKFKLKNEGPIKTDYTSSRAAGSFFEVSGQLYRAAQDCTDLYGGQTRIMEVDIEEDKYRETEVRVVNSYHMQDFNEGLHTFNPWNKLIVVDGFNFEPRPLMKPLFYLSRLVRRLR